MNTSLPVSAAAERNKGPILQTLQRWLGEQATAGGRALEIAAGTGQHAAFFAAALPAWQWQPTEADPGLLPVIAAHTAALANVAAPVLLDLRALPWTVSASPGSDGHPVAASGLDLVYCANLLHIAPWACCAALMGGAAAVLRAGGFLVTYGPYRIDGEPFADSNQRFDDDLRARDPAWGIRRLVEVAAAAQAHGLMLEAREVMPANNQLLRFRRVTGTPSPGVDPRHGGRDRPS